MKVNINRKGKKESYTIIDSWDDVTLENWMKILEAQGNRHKEDVETLKALSDIPETILKELDLIDVVEILKSLTDLQKVPTTRSVRRIYKIDGVKYGFHPNLEKMTLGEWIDCETLIGKGLSGNMHYLMAILFRPILKHEGKKYNIEAYSESELEIRAEIFKTKMKAIDVRNATVFFWTLGRELKTILERYSVEKLKQATQDIIQNEPLTKNMDGTA